MMIKNSWISGLFDGLKEIALIVSSFYFLTFALAYIFKFDGIGFNNFFILTIVVALSVNLISRTKHWSPFLKTVKILGSISFLSLFIAYFFFSGSGLAESFGFHLETIEIALNTFVIGALAQVLIIISAFFLAVYALNYSLKLFSQPVRFFGLSKIAAIILFAVFVVAAALLIIVFITTVFEYPLLPEIIIDHIVNPLLPILGFSLFYLHINFLIRLLIKNG